MDQEFASVLMRGGRRRDLVGTWAAEDGWQGWDSDAACTAIPIHTEYELQMRILWRGSRVDPIPRSLRDQGLFGTSGCSIVVLAWAADVFPFVLSFRSWGLVGRKQPRYRYTVARCCAAR